MRRVAVFGLLVATSMLGACDLAPKYVRSVTAFVPPQWPSGAAYAPTFGEPVGVPWRTLIADPKLQVVIERALMTNQDLAAAVANVAAARAQYDIQRSYRLPALAATGTASINHALSGGGSASVGGQAGASPSTIFSANIGISGFEIDLFGRQRNLSRQAFAQYLATESGARATRLAIVAETATAYATLAADQDLLAVARAQVTNAERTVRLTRALHNAGLVSGSDIADAATVLAQARADVENFTTQAAQSRNALELLVGGPIEDSLISTSLEQLEKGIGNVPAGLSSAVLLQRPDVVEAEHQLRSAYANIGVARAAFFPEISLTTTLGFATRALRQLLDGDASTSWSASPSVMLPLLGGPNRGNVAYARAQADYYLATYRKVAQSAYREVADTLARRGTVVRQRAAQRDLLAAATKSFQIAEARYRQGADSFLATLVAQRTLYASQQAQISVQLIDVGNRIDIYRAIGADFTL